MAMADPNAVPVLLSKLTSSLDAATHSSPDETTLYTWPDGISLLDAKNELLVSYLHNLVFLILLKLRHEPVASAKSKDGLRLAQDITKELVKIRLHLERGVRPVEARLRYQLDKVLKVANNAASTAARDATSHTNGTATAAQEQESDAGSAADVDDLTHRPNLAAFASRPMADDMGKRSTSDRPDGIYRPPRITPTAMPSQTFDDKARSARKPQRSRAVDEYIDAEMSHAPVAEPSIGSTIVSAGRHTKSDKERRQEDERTAYEESNFIRLAPPSKKERAKTSTKRPRGFGGEELRSLGAGLDRIDRLTTKKRLGEARADEGSSKRRKNANRR